MARADDYGFRDDYGSDYSGPNWDDESTDPVTHHAGPPGPGDTATIGGAPVTCSGGAVESLTLTSGCDFQLSGSFTATTFTEIEGTLSGAGTLTAQNLAGAGFDIEGGDLVAGTSAASGFINGGSLSIGSYVSQGPANLLIITATAGGQVTLGNSVTNFNGAAESGATMSIPGITNGMDITLTCNGDGSTMDIANDVSVKAGFLDVKDGGAFKVGGDLLLDGGTDVDGNHIGGGGGFSGAGTLGSVGGTLTIGDQAPEPGFSLGMDSGAKMNTNAASIGNQAGAYGILGMDGKDTVWNVTDRLGVGLSGTGELHLTNGAQLLFGGGQLFAVGLADGGKGTFTADGDGTIVDARTALTGIGENSGAQGSVTLTNAARFLAGAKTFVGASGSGSLNINSGSSVQTPAGSTVEIGSEAGSNGYLESSSPNGLMAAGTVLIGNQGTGAMYVADAGNSASVGGSFFVGGNGATFAASTGNGLVRVGNGAQLTLGQDTSSKIGLGNGSGSVGEIEVTDSGSSVVITGLPIVGVNGSGELAVVNGATGQSSLLAIATAPGSYGTMLVYNSGTTWTNTGNLFDGGLPGKAGGRGLIAVNDGGLLRVYHALYLAKDGLASVTATVVADPDFPNPPPPAGKKSPGRIFVGSDNFGPDGTVRVGRGGVLAGQGRKVGTSVRGSNVIGKVEVGLGGRFQPGGDPGVFSIEGDCDLTDDGKGGGETDFEVAGTGTAGTDYDQLVVSGKTTLGGTLKLVLLPGYQPKAGDVFNLVQAGSVGGAFTRIDAPGLTIEPAGGSGGMQVKVTAVSSEPAPVVTSAKVATAGVDQPFAYQIAATNDPAGFNATGLPDGLLVDAATGIISGIPTAAGVTSVTISSTNVGGTGKATLELTVTAEALSGSPVITSAATAPGKVGQPFAYQITATNAPTTLGASGLPPGLNVDAAGLISGTPKVAGTFKVKLSAGNAVATNSATLALTIAGKSVVTLTAKVPIADASTGTPGVFLLRRTGDTSKPLTVKYAVTGNAKNGVNYRKLGTTAQFKAGQATKQIKIAPLQAAGATGNKSVTLRLQPAADYTVGTTTKVKVVIHYGE